MFCCSNYCGNYTTSIQTKVHHGYLTRNFLQRCWQSVQQMVIKERHVTIAGSPMQEVLKLAIRMWLHLDYIEGTTLTARIVLKILCARKQCLLFLMHLQFSVELLLADNNFCLAKVHWVAADCCSSACIELQLNAPSKSFLLHAFWFI